MPESNEPQIASKSEVRRWIIATAVLHVGATALFAFFFVSVLGAFLEAIKDYDAELPGVTLLAFSIRSALVNVWFLFPVLLIGEWIVLGLLRPKWPTVATIGSGLVVLALFAAVVWGSVALVIPLIGLVSRAMS